MQMFRVNAMGYVVIDGHRVRIWRDRRSRSHAGNRENHPVGTNRSGDRTKPPQKEIIKT